MSEEKFSSSDTGNINASGSTADAINFEIISAKICKEKSTDNVVSSLLVYRQNLELDSEPLNYSALVITSIEEKEDGSISIDPLALATTSKEHVSQLSGLINWIRL
jgi:hypothetical protein